MLKRKDIAIVGLPHYNTDCLRVAVNKQMGPEKNYIVVCCSPGNNGIYYWNKKDIDQVELWNNKGQKCYCVPFSICNFVQTLESIKTPELKSEIIKNQKEFCKKYRKNEQEGVLR